MRSRIVLVALLSVLVATVASASEGAHSKPRGRRGRHATTNAAAADAGAPTSATTELSGFARDMLAAHDAARAAVSPAPRTPLPAMTWDPSLATLAQAWADRCPNGHRPNNAHGENMYFSSEATAGAREAVTAWVSEAAHYDYASGRCVRDGEANWAYCGHHTQVVWRDTTRVGCGIRTDCRGRFPTVVVCNYEVGGNVNATDTTIPRPY
ncbi:MAG: CAP domain-containing protein [Polyangiales bacterium]